MEDRHPIDKLFKDGLQDPEIPFDPKDWEKLSQKMRKRKRKIPLLVWMTSGVAASLVVAAMLLFNNRHTSVDTVEEYAGDKTLPSVSPSPDSLRARDTVHSATPIPMPGNEGKAGTPADVIAVLPPPVLPSVQNHQPAIAYTVTPVSIDGSQIPAVARDVPRSTVSDEADFDEADSDDTASGQGEQLPSDVTQRGWALSVFAAPDWSGTQPLSGKLSGNVGLLATYRINHWLSVSGGALYGRKMYQADFSHYRPDRWRGNGSVSPGFVNADCAVLDVPFLANATIMRFRRSDIFVSTGISSYFMLRETYDYRYPPEVGREPWELTVRNRNRHLLGVGNLSVGYRRQLIPSVSVTVQPFVKVPLTGIGNGNIKLYSTGVAISADIDLTRRNRR